MSVRRLTFVVRNGVVELLSEQQVEMTLIPEHALPADARHAFWYELRDANDVTIASHPALDPIADDIEVFSDDPAQGISRLPHAPTETVFSVVLPNTPGADSVVLMRPPTSVEPTSAKFSSASAAKQPREVARFKLSQG
jgi:hypothetical protein